MKNKEEGNDADTSATANIADKNEAYDAADNKTSDSLANPDPLSSNPTDIQALLALAMNLVQDNDVLRDTLLMQSTSLQKLDNYLCGFK